MAARQLRAELRRVLLVTGASSQIGHCLLPRIAAAGWSAVALSRGSHGAGHLSQRWLDADLLRPLPATTDFAARDLIHLAPLTMLPPRLNDFVGLGVRRVIAIGSTSRFSKSVSRHRGERKLAADLAAAEVELARCCESKGLEWTLFRPTLIYGVGLDRNISFIARFITRFGFFPLVGEGSGLRQPVHADDLAKACLQALDRPCTYGCGYDLVGGETLTYMEMVTRIFASLGRRPRFVRFPPGLLRAVLRAAAWVPASNHLTAEMADRMNTDLCFDSSQATQDFGYCARGFAPPSAVPGRAAKVRAGT